MRLTLSNGMEEEIVRGNDFGVGYRVGVIATCNDIDVPNNVPVNVCVQPRTIMAVHEDVILIIMVPNVRTFLVQMVSNFLNRHCKRELNKIIIE